MAKKPDWMEWPEVMKAHDAFALSGFEFPRASWTDDAFTLHPVGEEIGGRKYAFSGHIYKPADEVVAPNCDLVVEFRIDFGGDGKYQRLRSASKQWAEDASVRLGMGVGLYQDPYSKVVVDNPFIHTKSSVTFAGKDPKKLTERARTLVQRVNEKYALPEKKD